MALQIINKICDPGKGEQVVVIAMKTINKHIDHNYVKHS